MPLESYLEELVQEDAPLKHAGLVQLSSLAAEEMELVHAVWPRISPERRLNLISRLVETCEENVDMDFSQIFKLALKDEGHEIRVKAVSGLWECEERPLITTFIKLLECDPALEVKTAAAQALGKFAEMAEDGKLLASDRDRIQAALLPLVKSDEHPIELRRRALEAVGVFSDDAITDVINRAYKHPDARMRQSAIYAMGRNANPEWMPIIRDALDREEPAMRYEAALACGELGEEEMVPYLLPLLKDEDIQVRLSSIHALGAIGGIMARKALTACLRSDEEVVSQTAEDALESLESNEDPLYFKHRA